ncbi:MAG TPA: hypothetical protein VN948_18160 [Terriglobales bacterium]|nr:hypothetical protein [Terriglobales bacterium]
MRVVLLAAVAALALVALAFAFAVAWLVWGEDPWEPGAGDR